jgi:hypothetical protein
MSEKTIDMDTISREEAVERPLHEVVQPAPGWQKFETEKLELWLPDSYVGGDPRRGLQNIVERSPKLGPMYQLVSKAVDSPRGEEEWRRRFAKDWTKGKTKKGAVEFFFRAFDSAVESLHRDRSVHVLREKVGLLGGRASLRSYLSKGMNIFVSSRSPSPVLEQSIVRLGPYEAGRLMIEIAQKKKLLGSSTPCMWQLSYAIKGRQEFWLLQYSAAIEDRDRMLPVFEQSASTLRLKEVDAA